LAIAAYRTHRADRIVAEVNNGGDMVGATLRMVDRNVAFTAVRASRGKMVRVEPVAALYDQGRVHHIGTFPQLEDQMTNFTSDIDRAAAGYSPDRVDALVWAFSELLVEPMPGEGLYEFYRQQAEPAAPASHNLLKPCPSLARWSGSRRRRRKAEPWRPPRRDVYADRDNLSSRNKRHLENLQRRRRPLGGTDGSNPASGESTNFRSPRELGAPSMSSL